MFTMWPTKYMELKRIEELLICGICYEYMDTSVMTSCSHNYCSLCIRKYLHYKTQCPTCSEETFEKDLRKNKVLDEIIIYYLNLKEKLQKESYQAETKIVKDENLATICSSNDSKYEEKIDVYDTDNVLHRDSDNTTYTTSVSTPCGQRNCHQDISSPSTSTSPKVASIFTPKSKRSFRTEENCNMVACPVCKVDVPQNNINKHLDDCLKRENTKHQCRKTESKRKPLPKLVLSLMKDGVIRKRLKELGLSSQGDRKALESRLQRYIILYNAECDKINPRPVPELIKQCEEEENLEKKVQKSSNRLNINRNTEHNIIEKQRKKYLAANKDSFEQLIAKVKNDSQTFPVRRNILKKEKLEALHKNVVEDDLTIQDNEKNNFLPVDSTNFSTNDSDSNASCSLQMYSRENPTNFLAIELYCSSDDNSNQCALTSNHNIPNLCKTNSASSSPNVKTELLSCENVIMHEEASNNLYSDTKIFPTRGCNVLEDGMDVTNETSFFERTRVKSEDKREIELVTKRNTDDTRCSQERHVAHSLDSDVLRKRKHDMVCTLSDEEKTEDKSINGRKLTSRFGFDEAKGFNNENIDENVLQNKEKLKRKNEQMRTSYVRRTNSAAKRFVKSSSEVRKSARNNNKS